MYIYIYILCILYFVYIRIYNLYDVMYVCMYMLCYIVVIFLYKYFRKTTASVDLHTHTLC